MSRTGTVGKLFSHAPEPVLQMHPQDMAQLQITEGDLVQLSSPRSSLLVPVSSCPDVGLRQLFMAMHWGEEFINGGVNTLTSPAFCPDSKQPEFKHTAVKVAKVSLPWNLVAMAWLPADVALSARQTLQEQMHGFKFASCVPFAHTNAISSKEAPLTGILFCAAHEAAAPAEVLANIEMVLQLQSINCLRYTDPKRGQHRVVRLQQNTEQKTLQGFLLAGDTAASAWMRPLLHNQLAVPGSALQLLSASAQPPSGTMVEMSKTVCTCLNVSQTAIEQHLQHCSGTPEQRLASLKNTLKCGTNCGSCIPQLQRIVRSSISL
jgi:assimilatory nitrate reductase catalytic subunit